MTVHELPTAHDDEQPPLVEFPSSPRTAILNKKSAFRLVGASMLLVAGAGIGAVLVIALGPPKLAPTCQEVVNSHQSRHSLRLDHSRANDVLGDLSAAEVRNVARWFIERTGVASIRSSPQDKSWLSGPSAVELLRPPKVATIAYLDGRGPRPPRYARVTVTTQKDVVEYKVGPLGAAGAPTPDAKIEILVPPGAIPYSKRPDFNSDALFLPLVSDAVVREIGASMLVKAFGPIWPQFPESYNPAHGTISFNYRNDALAPAGIRRMRLKGALDNNKQRPSASWLHPIPLDMEVDISSWNISEWTAHHITFCDQGPFETGIQLRRAYERGEIRICSAALSSQGGWDVPKVTTPASLHPRAESKFSGVTWGPWSFSVTQRPSTGMAIMDVHFRGERILYELALMDAQAVYGGRVRDQFMYSDGAYTMSQWTASLKPGVDCPEGAQYISAANWMGTNPNVQGDVLKAVDFWPICIFEWTEDHTVWRHMDNAEVRGLLRRTVLVRSIVTVDNYDYIVDVKFREDGEIACSSAFAGYPETRWAGPGEDRFSTFVRPGVAGIVHSHSVAFKADFDIAGSLNALQVTEVKEHESYGLGVHWKAAPGEVRYPTKVLERHYVEHEGSGNSTFTADPRVPKAWVVVNRNTSSPPASIPRGYRVELTSFSTVQVHSSSHPFSRAMPWTKYHLAVTQYKDDEYRPSSNYVNFDGLNPCNWSGAQDLDKFLADGDSLLDKDLVAWIGMSKEHIVRQEDIPLVSNFGVSFSLQPFNFNALNPASNP